MASVHSSSICGPYFSSKMTKLHNKWKVWPVIKNKENIILLSYTWPILIRTQFSVSVVCMNISVGASTVKAAAVSTALMLDGVSSHGVQYGIVRYGTGQCRSSHCFVCFHC